MKRKVIRKGTDGSVRVFESMSEAARITGVFPSAIYMACVGQTRTAGGFRWEYADNKPQRQRTTDAMPWPLWFIKQAPPLAFNVEGYRNTDDSDDV